MVCRASWVAFAAALGCSSAGSDELGSGGETAVAEASTSGSTTTSSTGTASETGSTDDGVNGSSSSTGTVEPAPSPGCGMSPNVAEPLIVDDQERTFVLHLPNDYDPTRAYALVFAWHGRGISGQIASQYYGVEQAAAEAAIVVYPNGLELDDGDTGWDLSAEGYDMRFFDALYTELTNKLCVDTERVFSTGHSFGGYMSNAVGCYRGDRFRAIAPVAGGPPLTDACVEPVAAWIAHGTADPTVPFAQGEATRDHWIAQNGCSTRSEPADPAPCVAYLDCEPGYPVVWCAHDEAGLLEGHDWPTFAGDAIWSFFAQF